MSLIARDPWQMLDQWRKEMEQVLGGHPMVRDDATRVVGSDWMPAVDIKEEADRFVLHADRYRPGHPGPRAPRGQGAFRLAPG